MGTKDDPFHGINVSGDMKSMLKEIGTEKAKEIAMIGGGGGKARTEMAAALAAIHTAKADTAKKEKADNSDRTKGTQAFSIVDAASASVYGRSAAAAKAAPAEKTAARVAVHMAGECAPVNGKMVSLVKI